MDSCKCAKGHRQCKEMTTLSYDSRKDINVWDFRHYTNKPREQLLHRYFLVGFFPFHQVSGTRTFPLESATCLTSLCFLGCLKKQISWQLGTLKWWSILNEGNQQLIARNGKIIGFTLNNVLTVRNLLCTAHSLVNLSATSIQIGNFLLPSFPCRFHTKCITLFERKEQR